jgi:glutamate N-acetyltransferase/amino-acid N-acetyltransferase
VDAVSVVAPRGFRAAGVTAGLKPDGALDLALVAAEEMTGVAALFTTNQAAAAPVRLSRRHLAIARSRAVVINSGCANAATGPAGEAAAVATAVRAATALGCEPEEIIIGSTGLIGTKLPLERVLNGVDTAAASLSAATANGLAAAEAIMTTDTVAKEVVVAGEGFLVGGMAKGAGMVRPDMATMLVVLTTDAAVSDTDLDAALRPAVDGSFHGLNIDGCPSTNDMVVALASGASGNRPDPDQLAAAFVQACNQLARLLAADAEGASRVVSIEVRGARTDDAARTAGRALADSALVRASFYGGDPNWGRVVGALGAGPIEFDPLLVDVAYAGVLVARNGEAMEVDAAALAEDLAAGDFTVSISLGDGPGSATVLTTDLTPDYVRFNAEPS